MPDFDISPLVESWKIANLTNVNFGLSDVPGLSSQDSLPKMVGGVPQWIDALDYTTSDMLAASDNFRNALIHSPPLVGTEGYKHTHEGLYDIVEVDLPDATNWHAHNGLDILTAGPSSNADTLHTHNNFSTTSEINTLILTSISDIDLSVYVRTDGSINQLSDIVSTGEIIEASILQAHAQDHTLLDHTDAEDPFSIVNFKKLLDGSNADFCHVHSDSGTLGSSGSVRLAYCKDDASAATTIDCFLDTNTTGEEVTVKCLTGDGGTSLLNASVPRLSNGDPMLVIKHNDIWYATTIFEDSEDFSIPKLKYIVGYTIVDDLASPTSVSGDQWSVDKVIIKAIKVQTDSTDWDLTLWTNVAASDNGIYDNGYIHLALSASGDQVLLLDLPYIDYDNSSSVHLRFLDNNGDNDAIVDIYGVEART